MRSVGRLSGRVLGCILGGLLAACLAGCGGDADGQSLSCAWFSGDNCWKNLLTAAETCVAPVSESGTFDASRASCTHASGPTVTFTPAVTLPLPDDALLNFQISRQGATCLSYRELSEDNFDFTVQGQVFKQRVSGTSIAYTCPDGTTYAGSALSILSCGFEGVPGKAWSSSDIGLSVSFLGGVNDGLQALSCTTL